MPSPKRKIGDVGEEVVSKFLQGRGFIILERNYWKPWGEIDIVAKSGSVIRFVEVKAISRGTIRPEENMHPAKLKRLHRAVQTYLLDHKVPEESSWQIDLACVHMDFETRRAKVRLFENIIM